MVKLDSIKNSLEKHFWGDFTSFKFKSSLANHLLAVVATEARAFQSSGAKFGKQASQW